MNDKDWQGFYDWCKKKYRLWAPDKASVELWLQYQKEIKCK